MGSYTFDLDKMRAILKLNIGVNQEDNEEMYSLFSSLYPIKKHRYSAGREHNGWVVPHRWKVHKAQIIKDGEVLFDGTIHPMAVAGYSTSFRGEIDKDELDKHLFYRSEMPSAYAFHCLYNYRPWEKHWGFCVPYEICSSWGPGKYLVELNTSFDDGQMIVGEWYQQGLSTDTIVFNAHTCHPCQANDDMVGVFVLAELFKWLATENRQYSYLGIVAPEHLGTVFYLADMPRDKRKAIKLGCFVEMVGTDGPFRLQQSFTGQSRIDYVAHHVLRDVDPKIVLEPFRSVVGNDETVWEAPGIEIPMISISRWPYPEYHTSFDSADIMSQEKMDEALDVLKKIISILENDKFPLRKFDGLLALSNPKYNLYIERDDPVVPKQLDELGRKMGRMQDHLPRYLDGSKSILDLAVQFEIPFYFLKEYLQRFAEKDLVRLEPVPLTHRSKM